MSDDDHETVQFTVSPDEISVTEVEDGDGVTLRQVQIGGPVGDILYEMFEFAAPMMMARELAEGHDDRGFR